MHGQQIMHPIPVTPQQKPEKNIRTSPWGLALRIVSDFGFTIAIPAVLFSWIGSKADLYFQTRPLFIIVGLFLAMVFSGFFINRKARKYAKLYQNM